MEELEKRKELKTYLVGHDYDGEGKQFYLVNASSRESAIAKMCLWQEIELGISESYINFKRNSKCHIATKSELFYYSYAD